MVLFLSNFAELAGNDLFVEESCEISCYNFASGEFVEHWRAAVCEIR